MKKHKNKIKKSRNKVYKLVLISLFILISLSTASIQFPQQEKSLNSDSQNREFSLESPKSSDLFENDVLYTGVQDSLSINETALYTDITHYRIGDGSVSGYTTQNAEFPVDTTHGWEGYYYNGTISNIHDERDWIEQGNMGSDSGLPGVAQTDLSTHIENDYLGNHNYTNDLIPDPNIPDGTISSNSDFVRIHFAQLEIEYMYDFLIVYDESNNIADNITGYYPSGVWSPWYNCSILNFSMQTDFSVTWWGYEIDFYQEYNISGWTPYESTPSPEFAMSSISEFGGESSIGAIIRGDYDGTFFRYDECDVGFYQLKTIPRGEVIDASFSMDYYLRSGIDSNDFLVFCAINDDIIYTRGFGTINNQGKNTWHSSGDINIVLWENSSQVFDSVISDQELNISVGLISNTGAGFSGFEDEEFQEVYVDNVELILKAEANGTQSDINLQLDGFSISDSQSWGEAEYSRYDSWDSNPMQIELTTDAPKLTFDLYSEVYGYHLTTSYEQSNGQDGSVLTILTNGTVLWETYHNVFVPSQYDDYAYDVFKPNKWEIINGEDPTGLPHLSFTGGNVGDDRFTIESDFPGWWYFIANSSNRVISSSTELYDDSIWKPYDSGTISYDIGDNIEIRSELSDHTQIGNLLSSWANLTIYYPNETIYHTEDIHPDGFGNLPFSAKTIDALDTIGGVYNYRILWNNGTAAGGLNGTFEIKHNIQHTLLYPRDGISDFTTEAVFGDIIPVRVKLNDSDTGALLSNLNVEHNWITGNDTLTKMGSGIYDVSFDSLDLPGVGEYEVDFSISGSGFYSQYFTLNISIESETELKIIGLDNNIDYGTNFTIEIDYHTKPAAIGITDALIITNATDYYVEDQVTDGQYVIEFNSSSSFVGPGTYDIQINASQVGYFSQDIVTRIQILPRSVYFEILINSADCTVNKSYSANVQELLNFTIGVYTTSGHEAVTTGTLQLFNEGSYTPPFSIEEDKYYHQIDSSTFGLGINFVSVIFNETGYQSAAALLQISISRIGINIEFQEEDTILVDKRSEFSTLIYLEDPNLETAITNATVSYSWVFGTGFLTEVGGGYYRFDEVAPSQTDTYEITFTVTPGDSIYEPRTFTMTLVSQQPESTPIQWWWFVAGAGVLVAALSGTLIAIGVKNKKAKNREVEIAKLKHKTQIFDDITNIKGILLIEKNSGLLMYRHVLSGMDEGNEGLFSGFVRAILLLGKRFIRDDDELEKGMVFEKQEFIEFTHENFKILLASGHKIIVALILEDQASEELKAKAAKFIEEFEGIYASVLDGWSGNRSVFTDTTPKLFEEIFNLSLLRDFRLSDNSEIYAKKFITPNSISERVSNVIQTLHDEKEAFHLKTIISLIPEEDKLAAKNMILKFIKGKYIVPKK